MYMNIVSGIVNTTFSILASLGVFVFCSLLLINLSSTQLAFAAALQTNDLNKSFNAEGTINTVLYGDTLSDNGSLSNDSSGDLNFNVSESYVLGGKWRLDVISNNVTYFKANITMLTTEGQGEHFHVIVYKPVSRGISLLASNTQGQGNLHSNPGNNTSSFSGFVDIITNGVLQWRDVPMIASIYDNHVLRIYLDKFATNSHFLDKHIIGLINSIEPISNASILAK